MSRSPGDYRDLLRRNLVLENAKPIWRHNVKYGISFTSFKPNPVLARSLIMLLTSYNTPLP